MVTQINAAVTNGEGQPFSFETIALEDPRADELLVRITSTGLCHTDLAVVSGDIPAPFPIVLGHEGAGIVEKVGDSVQGFSVGDRVAMSFASCGHCANCLDGREAYCDNFMALNFGGIREDGSTTLARETDGGSAETVHGAFFGQSSFASYALVTARNAVPVPDGIDPDLVGPLGCGVQTGAGAVLNTLEVGAGDSIVIAGTGAVGLSALMAAVATGATTIIAVDIIDSRLEEAKRLGATHTINSKNVDVIEAVHEITGGRGTDFAIDTTGVGPVIAQIIQATSFGGTVGLLAVAKPGTTLEVPMLSGKRILNLIEGDAVPQNFIPKLIALYQAGRFPFDSLITRYPFADIDRAISDTQTGAAVKAVLTMP